MQISFVDIAVIGFATYYWALAISRTDGPFGVFIAVRKLGKLFECLVCLSLWMGAVFALLWPTPFAPIVYVSAIAGVSILFDRFTD